MATPVSGLYPGGSPYGSIRGTPASGAGYPGADPYAPDARPPGAGAGAYSPLLFGRGAATLPGELKLFVLCVATCATVAYARATGLLTPAAAVSKSEGERRFMV